MKKLITFSLWGNNPIYIIGAIKNALLAQEFYPDWVCRFYIDNIAIKNNNIKYLKAIKNTEIIDYDIVGDWTFNIKRFLPLYENIDYMISRDCDSRLSLREKIAVDQWIKSGKKFHIMRDHPFQFNFPILAGMFGGTKILEDNLCFSSTTNDGHFSDQIFLQKYIYPLIKNDCLIHDSIKQTGIPFSTPRINKEFIGDSFDIIDNRHPEYWKYII